jgi:hypothetical protein
MATPPPRSERSPPRSQQIDRPRLGRQWPAHARLPSPARVGLESLCASVRCVICATGPANAASAHRIKLDIAEELEAFGVSWPTAIRCLAWRTRSNVTPAMSPSVSRIQLSGVQQFVFAVAVEAELSGICTSVVKLPGVVFHHEAVASIAVEVPFGKAPVIVVMLLAPPHKGLGIIRKDVVVQVRSDGGLLAVVALQTLSI